MKTRNQISAAQSRPSNASETENQNGVNEFSSSPTMNTTDQQQTIEEPADQAIALTKKEPVEAVIKVGAALDNAPDTNPRAEAPAHPAESNEEKSTPIQQSPSTPRLRERRHSSSANTNQMDVKPAVPATEVPTSSDPNPNTSKTQASPQQDSNTSRRSLLAPTRVLPRRSCGRPTSLLATMQAANAASAAARAANQAAAHSRASSSASKKDSHQSASPASNQNHNLSRSSVGSVNRTPANRLRDNKSAPQSVTLTGSKQTTSAKNYSKSPKSSASNNTSFTPSTSTSNFESKVYDLFNRHNINAARQEANKAKILRISLPDGRPSAVSRNSASSDRNRFTLAVNGMRRAQNSSILDATSSPYQSNSSLAALNGSVESRREESTIFKSNNNPSVKMFNVLICVTGSVATVKLVELIQRIKVMFPRPYECKTDRRILEAQVAFKIVMTENSKHFSPKMELLRSVEDSTIEIFDDADEWSLWKKMDDPVLHIELRKWADLCLIAPLDANTLAKLSSGICDNLLTCVVRAWDVSKPLIYCPAMNVHMYEHPLTKQQLDKLQSFGYVRVNCVEKRLACGDYGMGGMASVESIANKVITSLIRPNSAPQISNRASTVRNNNPLSIHPVTEAACNAVARKLNSSLKRMNAGANVEEIVKRLKQSNQRLDNANNRTIVKSSNSTVNSSSSPSLNNLLNLKTNGIDARTKTTSGVTSLQNLQAVDGNSNGGVNYRRTDSTGGDHEENDFDSMSQNDPMGYDDESDFTGVGDDEIDFGRDQANYLDQDVNMPLPLDGSIASKALPNSSVGRFANSTPNNSLSQSLASLRDNSVADSRFNTSKFLALCLNKERNCFTCTICKHDYKNRKSMARHLKEQHVQGNIFHCTPCGVSYKRREKLIKHQRERHQDVMS